MNDQATLFDMLQKKGTKEILSQLRCSPKRYNQMKKGINEDFSSRTLDARLKELIDVGLITQREIIEKEDSANEYVITESGAVLESIIHELDKKENKPEGKEIFAEMETHFNAKRGLHWDEIWPQLKHIMQHQGYIETITQKKRNDIITITETEITIRTEKSTENVPVEMLKDAWYYLTADGTLAQNEYEKATYRSAFVVALFSQLPAVRIISTHPVIIAII
jgi:DNA-binding HxlR family transcriptional regulator